MSSADIRNFIDTRVRIVVCLDPWIAERRSQPQATQQGRQGADGACDSGSMVHGGPPV